MMFLNLLLNPAVLRAIIAVAFCTVVLVFGYGKGKEAVQKDWDADKEAQTAILNEVKAAQEKTTNDLVVEYEKKIRTITGTTITITKKVPVYVPSDSCPMPAGFRLLHNEAAAGTLPSTATGPIGTL